MHPMMQDFQAIIRVLSTEDEALSKLNSDWATRGWTLCVGRILAQLQAPDVSSLLELETAADDAPPTQSARVELFAKLVVRAASNRAWNAALASELPPGNWSGVLAANPAIANQAMIKIHADATHVRKALAAAAQVPAHPEKEASLEACLICRFSCEFACRQGLELALSNLWVHRLVLVEARSCFPIEISLIQSLLPARNSGTTATAIAGAQTHFLSTPIFWELHW